MRNAEHGEAKPYFRISYASQTFPCLIFPFSEVFQFCSFFSFQTQFQQNNIISQIVLAQGKKASRDFLTASVLLLLKTLFQYSCAS